MTTPDQSPKSKLLVALEKLQPFAVCRCPSDSLGIPYHTNCHRHAAPILAEAMERAEMLEAEAGKLREALSNLLPIAADLIDKAFERGDIEFPPGNISEVLAAQAALGNDGGGEG